MVWAIEYAESAKKQLRKLDKPMARRIVDFMDERVAISDDPRRVGKVRKGTFGRSLVLSRGRLPGSLRYSGRGTDGFDIADWKPEGGVSMRNVYSTNYGFAPHVAYTVSQSR